MEGLDLGLRVGGGLLDGGCLARWDWYARGGCRFADGGEWLAFGVRQGVAGGRGGHAAAEDSGRLLGQRQAARSNSECHDGGGEDGVECGQEGV